MLQWFEAAETYCLEQGDQVHSGTAVFKREQVETRTPVNVAKTAKLRD